MLFIVNMKWFVNELGLLTRRESSKKCCTQLVKYVYVFKCGNIEFQDALRKKLVGVASELQCTDLSEIAYSAVLERVAR